LENTDGNTKKVNEKYKEKGDSPGGETMMYVNKERKET